MSGDLRFVSPSYFAAGRVALLTQAPVAVLSLLVLDGGWTAKVCAGVVLGFWVAAGVVAARRPAAPMAGDLWFWRWGFLPCFAGAWGVAALVR